MRRRLSKKKLERVRHHELLSRMRSRIERRLHGSSINFRNPDVAVLADLVERMSTKDLKMLVNMADRMKNNLDLEMLRLGSNELLLRNAKVI